MPPRPYSAPLVRDNGPMLGVVNADAVGRAELEIGAIGCRSALVLGGARSGKSAYALALAERAAPQRLFLATAEPFDEEMAARVARHQAERSAGWTTREVPLALTASLAQEARQGRIVLVDCLTLWLNNLLYRGEEPGAALSGLCGAIARLSGPAIFVSNEVGWGLVPETKLGRDFRDWQGRVNREVAAACDAVVLVTAGLARALKPGSEPTLRMV